MSEHRRRTMIPIVPVRPTAAPTHDVDPTQVDRGKIKSKAAGLTAIAVTAQRGMEQMGARRSFATLRRINQPDGFDCMGCAWPDPHPEERSFAEFCENGAKAVAEEATLRRVDPSFFAEHPVAELSGWTDYLLGQQGRITHPMVLREGGTHYEPISWDDAYALIAERLRGLASPDEAVFYTSGRASNEAAFAYQLFARAFGTNNLPDCSNMCHESTSVALAEVIGIGKGSVSLDDIHEAELILIAGQNPGTNHPRMLTALEIAKRAGAKIVAVNPLPETGLRGFDNPQKVRGIVGVGTELADEFLPIRLGGDLALFQAIGSLLVARHDAGEDVFDTDFIERHTEGFEAWAAHMRELDWDLVAEATSLDRAQIERVTELFARSRRTVLCWAMGVTQHRHAVATIKEMANVALVQGNIGKPGAGLCPVRGHSNVQGDRTMGIWEKLPPHFGDALEAEFGIDVPRERGLDVVNSIRAMRDGDAKVLVGLGGNFAAATPDTEVTHDALRSVDLVVNISTKLNRSHVVVGHTSLILPTLGRTERDEQRSGLQGVTVEDSMSSVHLSHGRLEPAGPELRSEVSIISGIAAATLSGRGAAGEIDWAAMADDYSAQTDEPFEPDTGERDTLQTEVAASRQAEMEARLAVRTGEERVRAVSGRADQLMRAAEIERAARARQEAARAARARGAAVAARVRDDARRVLAHIERSVAAATAERDAAQQDRVVREGELLHLRGQTRQLAEELTRLTDAVHRDEMVRAEQRLRIEQLEQRAVDEHGVDVEALIAEYGPDQPAPPSAIEMAEYEQAKERGDQVVAPQPGPFHRPTQEKRAARAERDLALLGKVNPLALEEFAALEERHQFLSTQLEDLKKTRQDLLTVVREVDERILEVFSSAYADVAREFEVVFAALFPGGDGRLVLTDPDDMLLTGIEVEARPPGKKVKRLSLLSGGERSLTAVALLVSIFRARPSPFYIMDEVEAALDDTNLGRLLELIAGLRDNSQLIIITHQKRTMEIADALYGVTMRGDGVTQVISQRLRDEDAIEEPVESAPAP